MESIELRLLRVYLQESGVPHRVTATTGGTHAAGSYHYRPGTQGQGLAMDLAGPHPSSNSPELLAIYKTLEPLGPHCAELIYSNYGWKNGRPYTYSAAVRQAHENHVHVALPLGSFPHFNKETKMAERIKINAPVVGMAAAHDPATGDIKGYLLVAADGGVFSFGAGAPFLGNVEYVLPAGDSWTPAA